MDQNEPTIQVFLDYIAVKEIKEIQRCAIVMSRLCSNNCDGFMDQFRADTV